MAAQPLRWPLLTRAVPAHRTRAVRPSRALAAPTHRGTAAHRRARFSTSPASAAPTAVLAETPITLRARHPSTMLRASRSTSRTLSPSFHSGPPLARRTAVCCQAGNGQAGGPAFAWAWTGSTGAWVSFPVGGTVGAGRPGRGLGPRVNPVVIGAAQGQRWVRRSRMRSPLQFQAVPRNQTTKRSSSGIASRRRA